MSSLFNKIFLQFCLEGLEIFVLNVISISTILVYA